ncbi:PAS domain-containing protein [Natronohydrobacter thiooxidans]|jgi:hypothetical protein|uniref:PAS domain-containing protein n=1 Tax=Natronohydrobacter thiooxidans TaxID=87172 RepID=UPI0008FF63F8|nr:PAS domain-containing protein [Natronohydrobacter thiooxidans]
MTDTGKFTGSTAFDSHATPTLFARVCAYWSSLRENGTPPRRAAIEAQALADALPHVFLAELVTPRVARLRICGHRIEALMGMEMRGMPLSVLFVGSARDALAEAVEQTAKGARVILSLEAEAESGMPQISATLALLPLVDEAGRITRLLGVLDQRGETGRAPRRFTLARPVLDEPPAAPARRPVLRVIPGGRR